MCVLSLAGVVVVWFGRRKWHLRVRRGTQFDGIRGHGSAAVHVDSRPPSLHHLPPGPDGRTDLLHPHQGRQQGRTTDGPSKMFTLSHMWGNRPFRLGICFIPPGYKQTTIRGLEDRWSK